MTARERFDEAAKAGWDADDEPPRNEDAEALMTMLDCPDVYGHRDDITRWFNERSQATAVLSSEPPSDPLRCPRCGEPKHEPRWNRFVGEEPHGQ